MKKHLWKIIGLGMFVFLSISPVTFAVEYDLTTNLISRTDPYQPNGEIYNIIFTQINPQPTGTGKIDPFVQIGQPGGSLLVEHAYNTTVFKTLDNGSSSNWNHQLLLSQVPTVTVNGEVYRQFFLDVNEEGNTPDRYLSLDEIQVYLSSTPNQSTTDVSTLGKLIYGLDGEGTTKSVRDDYIKLDYKLNEDPGGGGSGQGDMVMLIPDALFKCNGETIKGSKDCYVYLYSKFGEQANADNANGLGQSDGFEEWYVLSAGTSNGGTAGGGGPVPEPQTMVLLGAGLICITRMMKRSVQS